MNERVTYRQQFTYCGKPSCSRCREGRGHGPYWYAYITKNGQSARKYIGRNLPADIHMSSQENRDTFVTNAHSPLFKVYQMGQFRLARRNGQKWQAVVNPAWQHRNVRML